MDRPSLSRNPCKLSSERADGMAEEGIGRGDVDVSIATKGGDGIARLSREVVGQADEGDVSER